MNKPKAKKSAIENAFVAPDVLMPKRVNMAIEHAFGKPTTRPVAKEQGPALQWSDLTSFYMVIAEYIFNTGLDTVQATQAINAAGGPDDIGEYNRSIKAFERDLERFSEELAQLRAVIESQKGEYVVTPEDHVTYVQLFEKLKSAQAYYQGVIHHAMINITDYSLQASAKYKKAQNAGK